MGIKISELPQASQLTSDDIIPIVQSGETKKVSMSNVVTNSHNTSQANTYSSDYINNNFNKVNVQTSQTTSDTDTYSCNYIDNKINGMVVNSLNGDETTKAPSVNIVKQTFIGTTLWENTSTSSSFAGQSITLANSIENYSYYEVLHKDGTDECYLTSGKIPVNKLVRLIDICSGIPHYRNVTALSGTSITFANCVFPSTYNSSNTSNYNSGCIPMKVIGYK